MRWATLIWVSALLSASGCRANGSRASEAATQVGSTLASPALGSLAGGGRQEALVRAEWKRDSSLVATEDLSHRDVAVRRAAARALARIGDARTNELCAQVLFDEDSQVAAWAAYGLGRTCHSRPEKTAELLAMRAADLGREGNAPVQGGLDPLGAIADALARCGTASAERTLQGWLSRPEPLAETAAVALGKLAYQRQRLDDATVVALLDAATRSESPVANALYAFGGLRGLGSAVQERLYLAVEAGLAARDRRRAWAIRALAGAGPNAVERLAGIYSSQEFSPSHRAVAARELASLGEAGQKALRAVLAQLGPEVTAPANLVGSGWLPLIALLESLAPPVQEASTRLAEMASLALPEASQGPLYRRTVRVRCTAAALLVGTSTLDPRLTACDPVPEGRWGALATLQVLDRGKIEGPRAERWRMLTASKDPVVRERALSLMPAHPEIPQPQQALAAALAAKSGGVVATAAQILAGFPDRATGGLDLGKRASQEAPMAAGETAAPDPEVIGALEKALAAPLPADAIKQQTALIDAAGALQLLSLKPRLVAGCQSENLTVRQHSELALRQLGERHRECPAVPSAAVPRIPGTSQAVTLRFVTELGPRELRLDPAYAPAAVERVLALARARFYDNTVVHRSVPGFVVQFGDPEGDGYGGAGRPPLPTEAAPRDFGAGSVGIAQSGWDSGSSQLFITLEDAPHLGGEHTWIGQAGPGWDTLAVGDVIQRVEVVE